MCAVTKRRVGGVLALTQEGVAIVFGSKAFGRHARAGVGAVAKRLVVGAPTGTKRVLFTFFQRNFGRFVIRNNGVAHYFSPYV
jgi:hypothetical protein